MARSRTLRVLLGIGLVGVFIIVVDLIIPAAKPLSTSQKFAIMFLVFVVGLTAGWLLQRRWAIVGVPLLYIVSVWSVRLLTCRECIGPMAGIGFFRAGYYGLLGLSPMVLGAWLGVSCAVKEYEASDDPSFAVAPTLLIENPGEDEFE